MLEDHPYGEWIAEYAGELYQAVEARARDHLNDLAGRTLTDARWPSLTMTFAAASRLETDFWQMGLEAAMT